MPRDNRAPPVKLYYRIGEVAELVGVEPHVLRYWESEFPTIRPQKSRSGQRVYSRRDVEKLLRVKDLLYAQRFTIAGARQRLRGTASEVGSSTGSSSTEQAKAGPSPGDHASVDAVQELDPTHVKSGTGEGSRAVQEVVTTQLRSGSGDGARAAATAMRSALMAIREQVVDMLTQIDGSASESNS